MSRKKSTADVAEESTVAAVLASVVLRNKGGDEFTANGDAVAPGETQTGVELPAQIEGERKCCEIENQSDVSLTMTVGDSGDSMEIPAGATITVNGSHAIKLEGPHAE